MFDWSTIMNLHNICCDIDRPFFEAIVQRKPMQALHILEGIDQPTDLIKQNLEDIIIAVCGSQPLDEVMRWLSVRSAFELDWNMYTDCVVEAIKKDKIDTAQYMYDLGMDHDCISDDDQLKIIWAAVNTKKLGVVQGLCKKFEGGGGRDIVKILIETGMLPINNHLFSFVGKKLTPEELVKAEELFERSKMYVFGFENDEIEYGEKFWEGMKAYQQRERLGREVEEVLSTASSPPKSKM